MVSSHVGAVTDITLCSFSVFLRLLFTSDGVVVGVVIRSVERYDPTSENQTDGVGSRTPILTVTPARCLRSCEN